MPKSFRATLEYSTAWINIIKQKNQPDKKQAEWIISESLHNFAEHFNK